MTKKRKQIIHVNRHHIASNKKQGAKTLPVFTVKTYKSNNYGHEVHLKDDAGTVVGKFVYSPDKPLACGAVVWFESTTLDVEVL